MNKYYFTYGLGDDQPYYGGWTEVIATDIRTACALFRAVHPDKHEGFLNCFSWYTEEEFKQSNMSGDRGNFGKFCRERITYDIIREERDDER